MPGFAPNDLEATSSTPPVQADRARSRA
jgi:hypothetical protein